MYIPPFNKEDDLPTLLSFMQSHGFITLVSMMHEEPYASHIPVVVRHVASDIVISGHLAKANPQCQYFDDQQFLAVFSGPHAYISPKLYDKAQSVPTWNYAAVHAYGIPVTLTDPEALERIIMQLVRKHDADYEQQWSSLSDTYKEGMMRGIVGFEMHISKLEGKFKLSQNKTAAVQQRVASALAQHEDALDRATGELMLSRLA